MRPWVTAGVVVVLLATVTGLAVRQVAGPIPVQAEDAPAAPPEGGAASGASRILIFYTGEQRGYLEPCGCSKPMIGGIARRGRYFAKLPPEIAALKVDNGDLVEVPDRQHALKAEALAQFYQKAAYDAVNLGEKDYTLGFGYLRYLQRLSNVPFLSANVTRGEGRLAFEAYTVRSVRLGASGESETARGGEGAKTQDDTLAPSPPRPLAPSLNVAIVGVLSASHAAQVTQWNPDLKVEDPAAALDRLRPELEAKAQFVLLLFHGELEEARELVKGRPWIHAVVTAHEAEEYRARPVVEGGTMIVNAGQKGKHLGQLEIKPSSDGKPAPEALLPVAMEETIGDDPATREILRQYLSHVTSEDLLSQIPKQKTPNGQSFAGTAKCLTCHAKPHQVWTKSAHAKAFQTLAKVGHQADPDCVGCHVVGLEYQSGFRKIEQTPHLKDVGCESCHKPQATHARNPRVFKPKKVGAAACATCHVPEHSPRFDFKTFWAKIRH